MIRFLGEESNLRRFFGLIGLLLFITSGAIAERHVVVIHSYHPEFSWTQRLDNGFHDALYAALEDSRNRILTMAQVHELLYGDEELPAVGARGYLEGIVRQIVSTSERQGVKVEVSLQIENLPLSLDTAVPVGLIVNELITNSVRHAFIPAPPVHIETS